jgi:APA family basic amino acid/polyamine antiporter
MVDGSFLAQTSFPEGVMPAGGEAVYAKFNLPALIGIAAVTMLLVVGINESATVNNIIVFIKVGVVIAFIAIGMFYVNFDNWSPLVPERVTIGADGIAVPAPSEGGFWGELKDAFVAIMTGDNSNRYGIGGVIHAAAIIFFAYIGFEAVSTAGAEAKNPARDMPIGILGSLIICTILYILTAGVLVGIVPYQLLDNPAPIALAVNEIGLPWFSVLIKIGAIAGLSSVMLVLCYGQTRIFYTMARDGLLPPFFGTVHKKFQTPWINTLIVGLLAGSGAAFMSLDALSELTNVGTLAAFMIVCLTVLYLRFAAPNLPRPFKAPLGPVTPIVGAALCLLLLMTLMTNPHTRDFFLRYVIGGIVVYFIYGFWFSKLGKSKG